MGALEPGPANSIADAGVTVGHVTVWREEPVVRTGVTAVVPADPASLFDRPLAAGTAVLNGAGEMTGSLQAREWGAMETRFYRTARMAVGRFYDGAGAAAVAAD